MRRTKKQYMRTNEWAMKYNQIKSNISKLKNVIFQYTINYIYIYINYILINKQIKNIYN